MECNSHFGSTVSLSVLPRTLAKSLSRWILEIYCQRSFKVYLRTQISNGFCKHNSVVYFQEAEFKMGSVRNNNLLWEVTISICITDVVLIKTSWGMKAQMLCQSHQGGQEWLDHIPYLMLFYRFLSYITVDFLGFYWITGYSPVCCLFKLY